MHIQIYIIHIHYIFWIYDFDISTYTVGEIELLSNLKKLISPTKSKNHINLGAK